MAVEPLKICSKAYNEQDPQTASTICIEQKNYVKDNPSEDLAITRRLVKINQRLNDSRQAEKYLKEAKKLAVSDTQKHEVLRDHGSYYYHLGNYSEAELHFIEGLELAQRNTEPQLIAKSLNDLGLINLKKLDYKKALEYFEKSLKLKQSLELNYESAVTINNIALVYYRLGDNKKALSFYLEALEKYQDELEKSPNNKAIPSRLTHINTDLSAVYARLGQTELSTAALEYVLNDIDGYETSEIKVARITDLAEGLVESSDYTVAKALLEQAKKLLVENESHNSSRFYYLLAKSEFETNQIELAAIYAKKSTVKAERFNDNLILLKIYKLNSQIAEKENDYQNALNNIKLHVNINDVNNFEKFNQELSQVKYRLESEHFDRKLLEKDNALLLSKSRNKTLLIVFILATTALLLVSLMFYIRSKLAKERKKQLALELHSHKKRLEELEKPLINFKNYFSNTDATILICSDSGYLIFTNIKHLTQKKIRNINIDEISQVLSIALDSTINTGCIQEGELNDAKLLSEKCFFSVTPMMNDEYFIFEFYTDRQKPSLLKNKITMINRLVQPLDTPNQTIVDIEDLRMTVVDIMNLCVNAWLRITNTNKVEFAEASKIWKINIDEGRLRTRSLDKYLSLKHLPKNPRLRNVIKTCHFLLSNQELASSDREAIKGYLDKIIAYDES